MKFLLGHNCTMFMLSGLVRIVAGIAIFAWPVSGFTPLVYLFGIPAMMQGFIHIYAASQSRSMYDWWWALLLVGMVYMSAGFFVLSFPDLTSTVLLALIGATWAFSGVVMVLFSIQLNREGENGVSLLLTGVLSLSAAVYLLPHLNDNVFSVLWALVSYGFLIGVMMLLFGLKARAWHHMYFDDIME